MHNLPPQVSRLKMLATLQITYEIEGPMRELKEAFLALLSNVSLNVYDRFPIFSMFIVSIEITVLNVQGVLNKLL